MNAETHSLCDLQRKALRGCDSAAKIAEIHGKRPYFKKIDLLCNRMKTDLCVTDKAVVNINSHGVAWAIKDFIFVFNRIINAWVILRDYFYSKSEGMQCVNETIDPKFYSDFMEWQNATIKLTSSLIQSFENLHSRDQCNSNRRTKSKAESSRFSSSSSSSSQTNQGDLQKIFDPFIAENSEQAQLSGGYLKSAVYKPLSSKESTQSDSFDSSHDLESFKLLLNDFLPDSCFAQRNSHASPLYKRGSTNQTSARSKTSLVDKFGMNYSDASNKTDLGGISPIDDLSDNP